MRSGGAVLVLKQVLVMWLLSGRRPGTQRCAGKLTRQYHMAEFMEPVEDEAMSGRARVTVVLCPITAHSTPTVLKKSPHIAPAAHKPVRCHRCEHKQSCLPDFA